MPGLNQNMSSVQPPPRIAMSLRQGPSAATVLDTNQAELDTQPARMPPLQQARQEFNKAIMRAAEYEGSIENAIRDKVERLFPTTDKALKENIVAQSVETVAEANQAFEFNHLGNDLLEFPAVEYMAMSFVRRVLKYLAIAQDKDPSLKIAKTTEDNGLGFLEGWKSDDAEWAKQLNAVLNEEKINARVLTTLAYHHKKELYNEKHLRNMGEAINKPLLLGKQANPRVNIFGTHTANSEPQITVPTTVQPHGWPWLKYFEWNVAEALGNKTPVDTVTSRPATDPHSNKKFKIQGMLQAIKPGPYRRGSFSLSERAEHESGYGHWIINDKSLASIDSDRPTTVNWRQQNMDKKLPMFAGPSSTTSLMYEVARLLDLPTAEAQPFRALLLGWMIQARDHSFTEIMGALDAYAMEFAEKGPAVVASDEKMAWRARQTGDWLSAYEDLVTEDIDLPAMEAETINLNGQKIYLPALAAVKISRKDFDQFVTQGKGYPSQYASDDYLLKLGKAIQNGQEMEADDGLASERILYAPQNSEDLKLYNAKTRKLPLRPARTPSDPPFLDAEKDKAVTAWLDNLQPERRTQLLESSASLLAESTQPDAISNVWSYNGRNDVWETFLTVGNTNMLAGKLKLDTLKNGEDPFYHLLDIAAEKQTPEERKKAILTAIGDLESNQDILIKGMLLAVTRLYTGEATNIINPGYGSFAPPKDEAEMSARLRSVLKQKSYTTPAQRAQVLSERNKTLELLHAALESPMFKRRTGTFWHGSHVALADALQKKGRDVQFPGFMSTTYDPDQARGFMTKGGLLVIDANSVGGAMVEGISNAPGEKEILFPAGMLFNVDQTYTLHIAKLEIPEDIKKSKVKTMIFLRSHGNKVSVRVTTPEMDRLGDKGQSDAEGERKLADLIERIKNNGDGIEPETKVILMSPSNRAEELYEEEKEDEHMQKLDTATRPLQMLIH